MAFGARFSSEDFVDSTGNALDDVSLSAFLNAANVFSGFENAGEILNQTGLFEVGAVVCLVSTSGGIYNLGGSSPGQIDFGNQLTVHSYRCCIDYNGNNCADQPLRTRRSAKVPINDCPNTDEIIAAIDNYVNDVTQVNEVLDNNKPDEDLRAFQAAVSSGLFFESNETAQLKALGRLCNPKDTADGAAYSDHVKTVMSATEQVLGAITNIQQGVAAAQDNIDTINRVRCCTILPGLDNIFAIATLTLGVARDGLESVVAPRPQTCNAVTQC